MNDNNNGASPPLWDWGTFYMVKDIIPDKELFFLFLWHTLFFNRYGSDLR
jgi:hypothetical protein